MKIKEGEGVGGGGAGAFAPGAGEEKKQASSNVSVFRVFFAVRLRECKTYGPSRVVACGSTGGLYFLLTI